MADATGAADTSVVIPAFNEARADRRRRSRLLTSAATWHEILVVDDGSTDDTGAQAAAAGARVIRHPYNKGNGAAVKTGIRHATGALRADHRRRRAASAGRRGHGWSRTSARTISSSARDRRRRRPTASRRLGNALLNGIASYLTERPIPDLTSGFRAARRDCLLEFLHLLPNGFSTPTTTTLAFMKAGYSVRFEPVEAAQRRR